MRSIEQLERPGEVTAPAGCPAEVLQHLGGALRHRRVEGREDLTSRREVALGVVVPTEEATEDAAIVEQLAERRCPLARVVVAKGDVERPGGRAEVTGLVEDAGTLTERHEVIGGRHVVDGAIDQPDGTAAVTGEQRGGRHGELDQGCQRPIAEINRQRVGLLEHVHRPGKLTRLSVGDAHGAEDLDAVGPIGPGEHLQGAVEEALRVGDRRVDELGTRQTVS